MNKPITYWLSDRVAAPLANEYGQFLEHMTKDLKLLLINILSGVLHQLETNPLEEFTTAEYIHEQGIPEAVVGGLRKMLAQFDDCDASTIETVILVLSQAVADQSSQDRQRQSVAR